MYTLYTTSFYDMALKVVVQQMCHAMETWLAF